MPSKDLYEKTKRIVTDRGVDNIQVYYSYLQDAIKLGKELKNAGTKVFISRRATKAVLEENIDAIFVDVETSTSDYIATLKYIKRTCNKVAFFTYKPIPKEVWILCNIMGIQAKEYRYGIDPAEGEECIRRAIDDGFHVGIGGVNTKKYAHEYNFELIVVENSEESINAALDKALQLLDLSNKEKQKRENLKFRMNCYEKVFNFTQDAVVTIDNDGYIRMLNEEAKYLAGLDRSTDAIGKKADMVFGTKLLPDSNEAYKETQRIVNINDKLISINIIPIEVDDKIKGNVVFMQDIKRLQDNEQKIRYKIHLKNSGAKYTFQDIVGCSNAIKETKQIAKCYAKSDSTVLIYGETGTGKELFAQSIHNNSVRKDAKFVAINCAAISNTLLEAELFGYEEGSFTGAIKGGKAGLFEIAHGGTIFLDEIGEIPKDMQTKLLRVLEEKEIRRIGSHKVTPVNIRVIAATNKNLEEAVRSNEFREDLYYRLNILELKIPPLRDRKEDIKDISIAILNKLAGKEYAKYLPQILFLLQRFKEYNWPGNVRELNNVVERFYVLLSQNLSPQIVDHENNSFLNVVGASTEVGSGSYKTIQPKRSTNLAELEKNKILDALLNNNMIISKTADELGISRTTLWRRLKKYNITVPK